MAYRGGFGRPASLLGATAGAIVPASIMAGLIGTVCVTVPFVAMLLVDGFLSPLSLESLINALMLSGMMIAIGSFAGTFVVGWFLAIFGLPVALLMGERIRTSAGLLISVTTAAAAALIALRWMWGTTAASPKAIWEDDALIVFAFVLPAAWFYRRQVIAMLDELPDN
ncbi:hypothetical protein [Porphyrobacter sp. YT40]|uniref:hypothetical protein n=1 Tax=Porphyrobacter sp. YT40 TaxID=2547601 RepID=UPI00114256BE|nr:hypothetical protein [Porphyrobacter sp. YT40]QDH33012.1 hypothetical protein E2E27_00875 [Porphyrobacter sp. YT40]